MGNQENGTLAQLERLETRLALTESLLHNFAGGLEICGYGMNFQVSYVNDGFTNLTGYTRAQLADELENNHNNLILPVDVAHVTESLRLQLAEKHDYSLEYRIRRRSGQTVWILDRGRIFQLEGGRSELSRTLIDITKQKQVEEALRESNKRYEIGMEFSDVTIFDYDVRTKRMEHHWRDVVEYQTPHILDNAVESMIDNGVVQSSSSEAFRELYRKIERGEPTANTIIHAIDANGNENILEIKLTSIFENGSKIPTRAIGVKKDITKAMLLQREREYGNTLIVNCVLAYEADITKDKVLSYNEKLACELGLTALDTHTDLLAQFAERAVVPEDREAILNTAAPQKLRKAFERGQKIITTEFRGLDAEGIPRWHERTINMIKEELSGDMIIRCYIKNIDDHKRRELRANEERKHYEAMLSKSAIVYEVDVTNDAFLSGLENWRKILEIELTSDYNETILRLGEVAVYPADRTAFLSVMLRNNILDAYARGKNEIKCEYRRLEESGGFAWARCTMHLFEDIGTGGIKGFAYVEKIDDEKCRELALIYKAQHDPLTGFYNKSAVEECINEFLSAPANKKARHVFFILDLDRFKQINDNFGHAFGDAVLSQFAVKLKALFHEEDLLGRIGGDEFVMLMKNVRDEDCAIDKAKKICEKLSETFTQNGVEYLLSVSVGIAFYSEHGKDYKTLYRNSDTALYCSKEHGRNCYSVYRSDMERGETNVREIDRNHNMEVKKFKDNISDYVFRILYESPDKAAAIQSVLALVGKHYNVSRAYVYENLPDGQYTRNTYEWCGANVESHIDKLQRVNCNEEFKQRFNQDGILYIPDIWKEPAEIRKCLEWQGIRSLLRFSIVREGKFAGFVGFDQYEFLRIPSARELSDMRSIANMLGMFITEMRAAQESALARNVALSIVNALDTYAYVCEPETYQLLFFNTRVTELFPETVKGALCYKMFRGFGQPCADCPMRLLVREGERVTVEQHGGKQSDRIRSTAVYIKWLDGKRVCMVSSVELD